MMLTVWLTLPVAEVVKAGELAIDEPDARGALKGQFRYIPEYLENPKAFPLDPLHLPLSADTIDADRPHAGVHGVFEDSLPDDWGRRLLVRRYKLGRKDQRIPQLLRLSGNQGLGALSYLEEGRPDLKTTGVPLRHLQELALLAERFEQDGAVDDDELSMLFQAGSSPGGARPKALIKDESGAYLAKFASARDQLDVVSLEAAVMELARKADIETADSRLLALGSRKCLLVKRFDINEAGGRNHLVSMQSLLKADGYYYAGYRDMAEVIRHVSALPARDLHKLYRQMVFNAMIGNTDDHLKNFLMLHDDEGWRLSPAFDLVPNIGFNREHVLRIGYDNRPPDLETLLQEAGHFGLKRRQQAREVVMEVHKAVLEWNTVFAARNVPEKDAESIGRDISRRLEKCLI
ncbi:MAG: type II toxin-antitoxin system HipA family toxin [Deltaproteobacteria bacterium]|nr:MAG: type II toxin-antitoxin system HipA family toxin [Deltaproteobacteria bacterium]